MMTASCNRSFRKICWFFFSILNQRWNGSRMVACAHTKAAWRIHRCQWERKGDAENAEFICDEAQFRLLYTNGIGQWDVCGQAWWWSTCEKSLPQFRAAFNKSARLLHANIGWNVFDCTKAAIETCKWSGNFGHYNNYINMNGHHLHTAPVPHLIFSFFFIWNTLLEHHQIRISLMLYFSFIEFRRGKKNETKTNNRKR